MKNNLTYGLLSNPDEIPAMIAFVFHKTPQIPKGITKNQQYCYNKLVQVSRRFVCLEVCSHFSFSAVILALPDELRESVCLFYLVCRGLDTVEDDMKPSPEVKVCLEMSRWLS